MRKENKLEELAELLCLSLDGVPVTFTLPDSTHDIVPLDALVIASGVAAASVARVLVAIEWLDTVTGEQSERMLDTGTIPGQPASKNADRRALTAAFFRAALKHQDPHSSVLGASLGLDERAARL